MDADSYVCKTHKMREGKGVGGAGKRKKKEEEVKKTGEDEEREAWHLIGGKK
ncbi:unnamed protein product [Tetraodon nigroviridis]|uniref:(spotted green pufferfish) hypothetical protein n=1 Tax=Tetraodon nigroviridis TaxID=99883 RepID=Q4T556_TETNG|nr:unnamed protein product [Tetraodon nigroviridis]